MDVGGRYVVTQYLIIKLLKFLIIVITVLLLYLFYPYLFLKRTQNHIKKLSKNLNISSRLQVKNYLFSRTILFTMKTF